MSPIKLCLSVSVSLAFLLSACTIPGPKFSPEPATPTYTETETALPPAPTATRLPDQIKELTAPVLSLTHDPHNPAGLYALLATNDLFYSQDRGVSWIRLPLPAISLLYDPEIQTTCPPLMQFDVRPSRVTAELLWVRAGQTLYRSDDGGKSWQARLENVTNWTASQDGKRLYALRFGMTSGIDGLYYSQDSGRTWDLIYTGLMPEIAPSNLKSKRPGCISFAIGPGENSLYLGGPDGLYRSFDHGLSWEVFNAGLPVNPDQVNAVPLMVSDGKLGLYAFYSVGEDEDATAHLIRLVEGENTPDEDNWQPVGESLLAEIAIPDDASFFHLYALVPDQQIAGQLYLGSEEHALFSRDYGNTWEPIELAEVGQVTRIASSIGPGAILYLWTGDRLLIQGMPGGS